MSGVSVSDDDYERLELALLAVGTGEFADVKMAMSAIIASAPEGIDVARLLARALARAADRVAARAADRVAAQAAGRLLGGGAPCC